MAGSTLAVRATAMGLVTVGGLCCLVGVVGYGVARLLRWRYAGLLGAPASAADLRRMERLPAWALLRGRLQPGEGGLLIAPISGVACVWFQLIAWREWWGTDPERVEVGDHTPSFRSSRITAGVAVPRGPLPLEDATGRVQVDPRLLRIRPVEHREFLAHALRQGPADPGAVYHVRTARARELESGRLLRALGFRRLLWLATRPGWTGELILCEIAVLPTTPVTVTGRARRQGSELVIGRPGTVFNLSRQGVQDHYRSKMPRPRFVRFSARLALAGAAMVSTGYVIALSSAWLP